MKILYNIRNYLRGLSIRYKIWAAFGVIQLFFVAIVGDTLFNLTNSRNSVATVVENVQPAAMATLELSAQIQGAASSLGFYLLSNDGVHKTAYQQRIASAEVELAQLKKLADKHLQSDFGAAVEKVDKDFSAFKKESQGLLPLAESLIENSPPLKYASGSLNPLTSEILGAAGEMVRSESGEPANAQRKKFLLDIEAMRYGWAMVASNMRIYISFGGEDNLKNVRLFTDQFAEQMKKVDAQKSKYTFEQEDAMKTIKENYQKFMTNLGVMVELHRGDHAREDAFRIRNALTPIMQTLEKSLKNLSESQASIIQNSGRGMVEGLVGSIMFQLGLLIVGMIVAGVVAILLGRAIVGRVTLTAQTMHDIATGEGDLTRRLPAGRDEIGRLAKGFNEFAAKIQEVIMRAIEALDQVNGKVQRLKVLSEQTSRGADQQQNDTQQAASAVTEITASVQEVARNTAAAAKKAEDVNTEASNGRRVVAQTIDAMDNLANEVESATQVIHRLQEHSHEIGEIVDIIKQIAEQTNLLALNAAIEAARAGEQGRGFAVVADEVRTLAARTQESTKRIEVMIGTLQGGTQEAVAAMDRGRALAKGGVEQAAGAGASLEQVTQAVGAMSDMNTQIASAAEEQSATVEQINKTISAIHHIAEENAAGAQQTHSAINELVALNKELQGLMRQFKIE